jgi:uncharacterized RDD family membrane protein YckC
MKTFVLVTPENVEFEYRIAGVVRRGLAWLVDQLLVATAVEAVLVPTTLLIPAFRGFAMALQFIGYFAVTTLFPIVFEARDGQTPGKKALHIRVISDRGTPPTTSEIVVRNLARAVDALPLAYLLGGLCCWLRRDGRRLGDRAGGTIVVEHRGLASPRAFRSPDAGRFNTFLEDRALLAKVRRRLDLEDREALIDLCLRRAFLEEGARLRLFGLYADFLRSRLPGTDLTGLADERLVVNCVEALLAGPKKAPGAAAAPRI